MLTLAYLSAKAGLALSLTGPSLMRNVFYKSLPLSLLFLPVWTPLLAQDLPELRTEFPTTFDATNYQAMFAFMGIEAAGVEIRGVAREIYDSVNLHEVANTDTIMAAIRDRFEFLLLDPYSAEFRGVRVAANGDDAVIFACGLVNAKNSYGAYVGYQPFLTVFINPQLSSGIEPLTYSGKVWGEVCDTMNLK